MTKRKKKDQQTVDKDLLYTNPLLSDDVPAENVQAVLALLGDRGLHLIHEWLRRSLAYTGVTDEPVIPLSSSG